MSVHKRSDDDVGACDWVWNTEQAGLQGEHTEAPEEVEYVPFEQGRQRFDSSMTEPAGQTRQARSVERDGARVSTSLALQFVTGVHDVALETLE